MKRLMVMLSAVAVGFGLFAADDGFVAGTGFESDAVGPFAPTSGWTIPTGDANQALTVTAYDGDAPEIQRPAQYQGETNAKFLDVKTSFGSPITCDLSTAQDMGGIYFDSLVKFTACDEDPADDSYAGAKLVVYTKEIEGDNDAVETHIIVKAGLLSGDGTTVTPTAFDCGKWDTENWGAADSWARLTVKSIGNIAKSGTVPAFAVFINGDPVTTRTPVIAQDATLTLNDIGAYWQGKLDLFPSLITVQDEIYATEAGKVSKVGFDGQGKIDDLSFTTTVPSFCADPSFFTFTWDENVAGVSYVLGDEDVVTLDADQLAKSSIAIPYIAQETCTITVTPASGYVIDSWTGSPTTSGNAGTFALVAGGIAGGVTTKANEPKMTITINGVAVQGGAVSFADAMAIVNDPDQVKTGDSVVIGLTKDVEVGNSADEYLSDLYLDSEGDVVLDLAGHTITGVATGEDFEDAVIDACSPLTIIDSVGGGVITIGADASEGYIGSVTADGAAVVIGLADDAADKGATFEGALSVANGGTISIVRGFFDTDPTSYVDAGSEVGTKSGDYWPVAPKAAEKHGWAIYLAKGANENEFLISSEADLIALATWANKTDEDGEEFPTAGVTFKQTANIALTAPFAGIGLSGVKDMIRDSSDAANDATKFLNGVFKGTYDGGNYTISGFIHVGGDYDGFINSAYGATIKNIRISLGSATGVATGKTGNVLGVIAGLAVDTLVQNCVTLVAGSYNTFKTDKTAAGIVCYAGDGTVIEACTNNLNIVSQGNEKAGGLVACSQSPNNANVTVAGKGVVIQNCANFGNVTAKDGTKRASGLVSYTDNAVTFKGENVVGKDVAIGPSGQSVININSGSATVEAGAVIKVPAGITTTQHNSKAHAGLNYATVVDGVATLVADSAAAVNGANLKVMTTGNTITLAKIGDEITLDTSLFTATVNTTATDAYVKQEGSKYTVTEKATPTITVTLDNPIVEYTAGMTFPTPKVTGGTPASTTWNPAAIVEPDAGKTNEYVVTVTVAATTTTKAGQGQATLKVWKAAPAQDLPSDVAGGSDKQKADYVNWAKEAGVSGTGNENAAAFALGLTKEEITAAGDVTKAVQAKLDAEITSEMVAALVAGTAGQGLDALKAKYPNADFVFVPATELTSTDTAKFFKLQVSFKPAN